MLLPGLRGFAACNLWSCIAVTMVRTKLSLMHCQMNSALDMNGDLVYARLNIGFDFHIVWNPNSSEVCWSELAASVLEQDPMILLRALPMALNNRRGTGNQQTDAAVWSKFKLTQRYNGNVICKQGVTTCTRKRGATECGVHLQHLSKPESGEIWCKSIRCWCL